MVIQIGSHFPTKIWASARTDKRLFPFYHLISNETTPHTQYLYHHISVKRFEDDLGFLLKNFTPVDLATAIAKKTSETPAFHLSFDDGFKECIDVIAPILLKKGVPATFFINPGFIDNKALFHRCKISLLVHQITSKKVTPALLREIDQLLPIKTKVPTDERLLALNYTHQPVIDKIAQLLEFDFNSWLKQQQPYLSKQQVIDLHNSGFTIGTHSMDHPEFFLLKQDEIGNQVKQSIKAVKAYTSVKQAPFAFPFTDDKIADQLIRKLHLSYPISATFGTAGIKDDPVRNHFQRIAMDDSSFNNAEKIISSEQLSYAFKKLIGRHVVKRNAQ